MKKRKVTPYSYGEQGLWEIHHAITAVIPEDSIDAEQIYPLSPKDFIRRVLIPKAAVLLLMEDRALTREDALKLKAESSRYGSAVFPHNAQYPSVPALPDHAAIRLPSEEPRTSGEGVTTHSPSLSRQVKDVDSEDNNGGLEDEMAEGTGTVHATPPTWAPVATVCIDVLPCAG